MNMFSLFRPAVDVQVNVPQEKPIDIKSEIDWKIIDQLHNVVLNFSRNSMQSKKIMFTLLGVILTAMLQESELKAYVKWFPVIVIMEVLFWAFDSYTYFYQEKMREKMDARFEALKQRYTSAAYYDEFTLPNARQRGCRFLRSVFNGSVLFYPAIIAVVVFFWILIKNGVLS